MKTLKEIKQKVAQDIERIERQLEIEKEVTEIIKDKEYKKITKRLRTFIEKGLKSQDEFKKCWVSYEKKKWPDGDHFRIDVRERHTDYRIRIHLPFDSMAELRERLATFQESDAETLAEKKKSLKLLDDKDKIARLKLLTDKILNEMDEIFDYDRDKILKSLFAAKDLYL